jgi:GT2 family glycosyltransferase
MNANRLPRVAVVTLNWNGSDCLQECIDSILASDYQDFNLVVVDNGSTDGSQALLNDLYGTHRQITIIAHEENRGYSRGMNTGLVYAFNELGADYCLVMNNDTRLEKNAITALVNVGIQDSRIAFVTGKVYYYFSPDILQTVGKRSHPILVSGGHIGRGEKDTGQFDQDVELAFCDDIFWLVSRQVFNETGGYDPEFFLQSEDFDWQLRAKKAGFRIMYAHKAMLWHKESMVLGKNSKRKAYYDARNPMIAVMKNCEAQVVKKYLRARLFKVYCPAIMKQTLKGRPAISWAIVRGMFSAWKWKLRNS